MALKVKIPNPRLSTSELTYLDADYSSGTSLTVLSNLGFAAQDIAVVGEMGNEQTEQKDVSSVSGNATIVVSAALKFSHEKQTPIYRSRYNQVSIESQFGSSGAWSVLATQDIQWDKLETLYIDPNGADTYNYRFRFYNSISAVYSAYSPTISGAGFNANTVGRMLTNVRKKVRDPEGEKVTDQRIIEYLVEAQDTISGIRADWWFLRVDTFESSSGIASAASTRKYSLATYTDFNYIDRIRYLYNASSTNQLYDLTPKPIEEFDRYEQDRSAPNNNNVLFYKLAPPDSSSSVGYFIVYPVPADATCTFYPIYYKVMNTLNDISDTTNIPYPQILEDYAAWRIHNDLGNTIEAGKYKNLFFGNTARGQANEQITGIALLTMNQNNKVKPMNQPKSLWRYGGRGKSRNYYGNGRFNRDFIKENYM